MEPIVSPWLVYWIETLPEINKLIGTIGGILLIFNAILIGLSFMETEDAETAIHRSANRIDNVLDRVEELNERLNNLKFKSDDDVVKELKKTIYSLDYIEREFKERMYLYLDASKVWKKLFNLAKYTKYMIPIAIICIIAATLIPSKDTMYKMFIASYLTPDNLNNGVEVGKNSVEYFMQLITDAIIKIKETTGK